MPVLNDGMTTRSTIVTITTARQDIKKSRFLAIAGPVADETAAKDFVTAHSDQTAGHNCWAWRVGQVYRFSDDGEPGGTAGKPILAAIDGQGLDGIAIVVSRWFGGILLGSGGLMRAYGGTAALCLREAETVALIETISGTVTCAFNDLALVLARLGSIPNVDIRDQTFTGTGAVLSMSVPVTEAGSVTRLITDLTSGRVVPKFSE